MPAEDPKLHVRMSACKSAWEAFGAIRAIVSFHTHVDVMAYNGYYC
jgi:hypothetical protein